jgi:CheY-like chemotaxis protein
LGIASAVSCQADEIDVVVHEGGSILVMDDDEMVRELATLTLGRQGYTVMTCSNGREAISLYRAALEAGTPFSVVLMDLTIPGSMGGVETARQILAFDPAAPLVVSSGYSEDPVMANYKEYGFCAAIEKPYNVDEIARIISCNRR